MIRLRLNIATDITGIDNPIMDFIIQTFNAFCIAAQSHRPGAFRGKSCQNYPKVNNCGLYNGFAVLMSAVRVLDHCKDYTLASRVIESSD